MKVSKFKAVCFSYLKKAACVIPIVTWFALVLSLAAPVHSQQTDWTNAAGGLFDEAGNWDNGVPGPSDAASFLLGGNYSVEFKSGLTAKIDSLNIDVGQVSFFGNGSFSTTSQFNLRSEARFTGVDYSGSDVLRVQSGGILRVESGSSVSNTIGYLGWGGSAGDQATVNGVGSEWTNSADLHVGFTSGNRSTLNIAAGGTVTNQTGNVGRSFGSEGTVNLEGADSKWINLSQAFVGLSGQGTLDVTRGGVASASTFNIGQTSTGVGVVTVDGKDSAITASSNLNVGTFGNGTLGVSSGGQVTVGSFATIGSRSGSVGSVDVSGFDNTGVNSKFQTRTLSIGAQNSTTDGGAGSLTIGDYGIVQVGDDLADNASGELVVGSSSATHGKLNLRNGAVLNNSNVAFIGKNAGFAGEVNVTGAGTQMNSLSNSLLLVGENGTGTLNVEDGARVNGWIGHVGSKSGSNGTVTVTGADSQWNLGSNLTIGSRGTGAMTVTDNGTVNSSDGSIGLITGGVGNVTVTNFGTWNVEKDLSLRNSTLTIGPRGLVDVGDRVSLGAGGSIVGQGGTLVFGRMTADSFSQLTGFGQLNGAVEIEGYTDINSLSGFTAGSFGTSSVRAGNFGVIFGSGVAAVGVNNFEGGEVRTNSGEWSRFGGISNTNEGSMNVTGGTLEFENDLTNMADGSINNFGGTVQTGATFTNQAEGFVGGRGRFIAGEGLINEGVMAFTAGNTDIVGDVQNLTSGQIVTSGEGVTTFFDDVLHNGTEIRTASESSTVFLGEFTGAGSLTGTGTVYFEGDLRPGNSPDRVSFEGDVVLGSGAITSIELAGILNGEFDVLDIAGDFDVAGGLDVGLIDGFQLSGNQAFVFGEVDGTIQGQFNGLTEGALVGNYGGEDLFISYGWGGGSNVALFTSVPEPCGCGIIAISGLVSLLRRRRQS